MAARYSRASEAFKATLDASEHSCILIKFRSAFPLSFRKRGHAWSSKLFLATLCNFLALQELKMQLFRVLPQVISWIFRELFESFYLEHKLPLASPSLTDGAQHRSLCHNFSWNWKVFLNLLLRALELRSSSLLHRWMIKFQKNFILLAKTFYVRQLRIVDFLRPLLFDSEQKSFSQSRACNIWFHVERGQKRLWKQHLTYAWSPHKVRHWQKLEKAFPGLSFSDELLQD